MEQTSECFVSLHEAKWATSVMLQSLAILYAEHALSR